MAVDARDPVTGAPQFLGGKAPQTAQDLTTLGAEIYKRGSRLIGTSAERNAYAFPVAGLAWWDTTVGAEYVYTSGWQFLGSTTPWVELTLGTGWSGVPGHIPRCRLVAGVLWIEGAVNRGQGGALSNLAKIPASVPIVGGKVVFITGHTIARGATAAVAELYLDFPNRTLKIDGYSSIDTGTGWNVPVSGSLLADQT